MEFRFEESEVDVREDTKAEVCFRVTMFAMGVVRSFVKDPARNPTVSSSRAGRDLVSASARRRRCCRRKL